MGRYDRYYEHAWEPRYLAQRPDWARQEDGYGGAARFGNRFGDGSGWPRGFSRRAPGRAARGFSTDARDEELRSAVLRNLSVDRWLDASEIDVRVEDGVVTLDGRVPDYMQARYAWDDAWETRGVRGVVSRLQASPPEEPEE